MRINSLGDFISEWRRTSPTDVFQEAGEVDINYEPTAYYRILEKENPLILLGKLRNFDDFQLVTNTLGSRRRMAFALDTDEDGLYRKWGEITSNREEIKIIDGSAPIKEIVNTGEDIDLFSLPAPVHFSADGSAEGFGRYISGGLAIARDPLNPETINMSFTRIQIIGKDRYAFDMGSHGHLWNYVHTASKSGISLPLTVMIGAHPVFYMLAASFMENEFQHASWLNDFRYTMGIMNGIPLPSDAEISIEAEVSTDEKFREGPFSEFTGYMSSRSTGNVAKVKSIMRRRKPIFYDIAGSNSHEHVGLFSVPRNAFILKGVRQYLPPSGKYDVDWPFSSSHLVAFGNVMNHEPGISKQLGLALISLDALFTKIAFISEGEKRIPELDRALLGLAHSDLRPGRDVQVIPGVFTIKLDPESSREGTNGKAVLIFRNCPDSYDRVVETGKVTLKSGDELAVISRSEVNDCKVNVIVDADIDVEDPDSVMWALATRTRPDRDISATGGKLVIDARSKSPHEIPEVPALVMEKVRKRLGIL